MRPLIFLAALCAVADAAPRRLVLIKADGVPGSAIERWAGAQDPSTGSPRLPWIRRVFIEQGAWVRNFYTRGISLSTPAWSLLDSGRPLIIHGNAEYDRLAFHVYDYLNFFPFYLANARSRRADMPAVEVLEDAGIPLLIDHYPVVRRYQGVQLFQRGVLWRTLGRSAANRLKSRTLRELFDEWQTGFQFGSTVNEQIEREILERMADPSVDYLDFFFTDFDHVMHLANDRQSELEVLKRLDALVGRLWTAIQRSPRANDTVLVLLSDHGMNSDPAVYSQGYNLVRFFNSSEGGGHHVIVNRHPLTEFKLRGLDPFVNEVVSPSEHSLYLAGRADDYPTCLLDLDGNERASVYLRNSDWNLLQILAGHPTGRAELDEVVRRNRAGWLREASEIDEEMKALDRVIARQELVVQALPRKFTASEQVAGEDQMARRERARLSRWVRDRANYAAYAAAVRNMAAGGPSIEIPRKTMGAPNTIHQLQNYVNGPSSRADYFALLTGLRVRNHVQDGIADAPVDLVAARVDDSGLRSLAARFGPLKYAVFLYAAASSQAVILVAGGRIRYLPVAGLREDESGGIEFVTPEWAAGLPLKLFEDQALAVDGDRRQWLAAWHSESEWLQATHRTQYSNSVVGLASYFAPIALGDDSPLWRNAGPDTPLLRRFEMRKRRAVEPDLLVLASDHWNFNVRGFNPGGNHGSFFRISTHSTLLMAGSGVPAAKVIDRPYDSLSFLPTILGLIGLDDDVQRRSMPGPVIDELLR